MRVQANGLAREARKSLPALAVLALAVGCGAGPGEDERAANAGAMEPQERVGVSPAGPLPARGTAWVVFGADTVQAEVARTAAERSQGLMYREDLPPGTGMLFVFPDTQVRSFWMQNTYVPLDIAFMDADLRIVDIQQMEPETVDFHESRAPAMFALEVPQGWFAQQGIRVGDRAEVVFGP